MIAVKFPEIEEILEKMEGQVKSFHIKASMFDMLPTMVLTIESKYGTPDILKLSLLKNVQTDFYFRKEETKEEGAEENFPEGWEKVGVVSLSIFKMEEDFTKDGASVLDVYLISDAFFFQNSNENGIFKDQKGEDMLSEITDKNKALKLGDKKYQTTDGKTTLIRKKGTSDLDFIKNYICKSFTINQDKPFFFLNLDGSQHFTSLNKLNLSTDKCKYLLDLGYNKISVVEDIVNTMINAACESEDKRVLLPPESTKMTVGGEVTFNIKNSIYAASAGAVFSTTIKTLQPGFPEKDTIMPIDYFKFNQIESTQNIVTANRPESNLAIELASSNETPSNLITIETKIIDFSNIKELLQIGDNVYVVTSNPFSWYNGKYVIVECEYGKEEASYFLNLKLARSKLEPEWSAKLKDAREKIDTGAFPYTYDPIKSDYFKTN